MLWESIVAGYVVVLLREQILPNRFFADGQFIQRLALGRTGGADQSYRAVSSVYRALGLASNTTGAALLGYSLAVVCVLIVARKCRGIATGWQVTALQVIVIFFSAIYLGYYSKDVFVLAFTALALLLPRKALAELLILALMFVYSQTFRSYWLVVLVLYVVMRIAYSKTRSRARMILLSVLLLVGVSMAIYITRGIAADYYRLVVNQSRIGAEDATTMITPFVSLPQPAGGVVNNLITLAALVIPLPLAALGAAYYLTLAVLLTFVWLSFYRSLKFLGPMQNMPVAIERSVALIFAFVATQALFEPDYGSALRHVTPLLPLVLLVAWTARPALMQAREPRAMRRRRHPMIDSSAFGEHVTVERFDDRLRDLHEPIAGTASFRDGSGYGATTPGRDVGHASKVSHDT